MNGAHLLISDEEYLPLPKQLQPTPVGGWPNFTPYTGTVGDPALQLTPDKGSRPLQGRAKGRNAARYVAPSNDRTFVNGTQQNGPPHTRVPLIGTIGDPSLELTPDKPWQTHPPKVLSQGKEQTVNIATASTSRTSSDRTLDHGNSAKSEPQHLHSGNFFGRRQYSTSGWPGIDNDSVPAHSRNLSKKKSSGTAKGVNKKPETVAWVEKHGDVRSVYNAGKPVEESSRVETVSSADQKGTRNACKVRSSLEAKGDSQAGGPSKGKRGLSGSLKEKERTKLKPILHKEGGKRGGAKSNAKKHVTLVVGSSPGLGRPQINSTSVLSARLHELEDESFDAEGAVARTLQESEEARMTLGGRAAGSTNVPEKLSKYQGLISVDIPSQDVLDEAVEERLRKLRVHAPDDGRQRKDPPPAPDVLDVFTPDMIMEYPNLDVSHLTIPPPKLEQVPSDEVFHLYRRISGWEK